MKKAIALVFVLILTLGLVACKSNETGDIDNFTPSENSSSAESVALGTQTVELCLDAASNDAKQTGEFLSTNTTKIVVSAENLEQSTEVELFLYSQESTTEPILICNTLKKLRRGYIFKSDLCHVLQGRRENQQRYCTNHIEDNRLTITLTKQQSDKLQFMKEVIL